MPASTLLAFSAAGVADKTVQALLSLEGNMIGEDYDIVVGVSPFPNDNTADFLVLASSGF